MPAAMRFVCRRCGGDACEFTADGVCLPCAYEDAAGLDASEILPGPRILFQTVTAIVDGTTTRTEVTS
jgi:hypothetical protein